MTQEFERKYRKCAHTNTDTHSLGCNVVLEEFIVQGCRPILFLAPAFLKAAAVIPDEPVEAAFPSQPAQACSVDSQHFLSGESFFRLCFSICRHFFSCVFDLVPQSKQVQTCLGLCALPRTMKVLLSAQGIG